MFETEGDYIQNLTGEPHYQQQADGTWHLMDSAYTYHLGAYNIGPVTLPRVTRAAALALRSAAQISQAALETEIAAGPLAVPYATLIAQADDAQVPASNHPRRSFRAWALALVDLPPTPTN